MLEASGLSRSCVAGQSIRGKTDQRKLPAACEQAVRPLLLEVGACGDLPPDAGRVSSGAPCCIWCGGSMLLGGCSTSTANASPSLGAVTPGAVGCGLHRALARGRRDGCGRRRVVGWCGPAGRVGRACCGSLAAATGMPCGRRAPVTEATWLSPGATSCCWGRTPASARRRRTALPRRASRAARPRRFRPLWAVRPERCR